VNFFTNKTIMRSITSNDTQMKIVLLGDSITQLSFSASLSGWGAHIADHYQRRADVYNRGFSGYNTSWFLQHVETDEGHRHVFGVAGEHIRDECGVLTQTDVKLVTIFFGANDASDPSLNSRHYVSLPQFRSNLRKIVWLCYKNYGKRVHILLISPPPVHHSSRLRYQIEKFGKAATGKLERNMKLSETYADAVSSVANDMNIQFLNLWNVMQNSIDESNGQSDKEEKKEQEQKNGDQESWGVFLIDGLHFSREGNLLVGKLVVEKIETSFPDIAVSLCEFTSKGISSNRSGNSLKHFGPWHDEIDYKDPNSSFESKTKGLKNDVVDNNDLVVS